jgi:hypothetical protein
MLPVAGFDASRIELPDFGLTGGYGSELVALGDAPRVVLSLPSAGAKCPWACVDLDSGAVVAERGLRGEVRDGDQRSAWTAPTHRTGWR